MKKIVLFVVVVGLVLISNLSSADVIRGIDIEFVSIGNAGNVADTEVMTRDGTTGYGSVRYEYRIGKYEITNAQWNTFTGAAGAPIGDNGGYIHNSYYIGDQQPTNNISWYETLQFCNYLTSGDKSKGAYLFSGDNTDPRSFIGIDRTSAQSSYGTIYVLPNEDEWYKAAYYKPDGSGYSLYSNGINTAPIAGINSNYGDAFGAPWDVGSGIQEQNGTFDILGNIWEWNETLFRNQYRVERGGSFQSQVSYIASSSRNFGNQYDEWAPEGFRIVCIPEPTTLSLLGLGLLALRRKK